jgi:FkbM family methyltransferase
MQARLLAMISQAGRHENRPRLTTASPVKLWASGLVASATAGRVIGTLTRRHIRHQGLWFDTRSADFSPRVRAQMFWGGYEGAETRMIQSIIRASPTVVELGSSLGVTTAHIRAVMAPEGRLICVEANPRLIPGLSERAASQTGQQRVDVIHAAVTSHCGTAELIIAGETVGSRIGFPRPDEPVVQVPAMTLREILRRADIAEFDLVSDIEGAEAAFLLDDPGALGSCRRAVIEFHDTVADGRKVSAFDLIDAAFRRA